MSLNELKLLLAALTLAAGWIGGAIPLLGRRGPSGRSWVGAGNAFAAGLFLAIGLLHFLPESAASFGALETNYPTASLLAVASFLLLLLLEHVLLPEAAHDAAHAHSGEGRHRHAGHGHGEGAEPPDPPTASPYVLIVALSVHSVLAGFVLGADADSLGALLTFVAIAVHKGTAGLALGMALVLTVSDRKRSLKMVAAFALMTPIGILLGMTAGTFLRSSAHLVFDAGASALAAGTFLYIGAFDLLQDEFLRPGRRWVKWLSAVAGVALASLVVALY